MAERPYFTIVTPVYKGRDFLAGCVNSVREQGFDDYEHLLIDDGSPDDSGALCDSLAAADGHIRVIHQQNAGVTGARNTGIRTAKGLYLLFLDQDDRFGPCALQAIHNVLIDCGHDLVSWRHHGQWAEMCTDAAQAIPTRYAQPDFGKLYNTGTVHYVWTKAFPVDFLREKDLRFDETIQDGTDDLPFVLAFWRAWFDSYPSAGILYISQFLYYYEIGNDASVSNKPQPFLPSHLTMFSDLLCDLESRYHVPPGEMALARYQTLHTLAYSVYSTPPKDRRALRKELFCDPRFTAILDRVAQNRVYSPFYLPFRFRSQWLIRLIFRSYEGRRWLFWKAYRLGLFLLGSGWRECF